MAFSLSTVVKTVTTKVASVFGIRAKVEKQIDGLVEKAVLDANGQVHSITHVIFKNQMAGMAVNLSLILFAFSTKYFASLKVTLLCVSLVYLFIFIKCMLSFFNLTVFFREVLKNHKNICVQIIVLNYKSLSSLFKTLLSLPKTLLYLQIYKEAYEIILARFSALPSYQQWFYRAVGGEDLDSIAKRIAQNSLPKIWRCIGMFVGKFSITLTCYTLAAHCLIIPLTRAYTHLGWFETLLYPFVLAFETLAKTIAIIALLLRSFL